MEDNLNILKPPMKNPQNIKSGITWQQLFVLKLKHKLLGVPKNQDEYFLGEIQSISLRKSLVWLCSAQLVLQLLPAPFAVAPPNAQHYPVFAAPTAQQYPVFHPFYGVDKLIKFMDRHQKGQKRKQKHKNIPRDNYFRFRTVSG